MIKIMFITEYSILYIFTILKNCFKKTTILHKIIAHKMHPFFFNLYHLTNYFL